MYIFIVYVVSDVDFFRRVVCVLFGGYLGYLSFIINCRIFCYFKVFFEIVVMWLCEVVCIVM